MNVYRVVFVFLFISCFLNAQEAYFKAGIENVDGNVPWTAKAFNNATGNFKFAIISDRTFGHRPGVFGKGSIVNPLKMRYFYLPGNHDVTNPVMTKEWEKRYGHTYYHFLYKDVLFLVLNSMDTFSEIGDEQYSYFKNVLEQYSHVRWTFVMMHHPLWNYRNSGFERIESLLNDRYTVVAGHRHRYSQETRKGNNYIVLGTTGGSGRLRGPRMGEFDHITWVTMKDDEPSFTNLTLEGVLKPDIATKDDYKNIKALSNAAAFKSISFRNKDQSRGELVFPIYNSGSDTLYFNGQLFDHSELTYGKNAWNLTIPPQSNRSIQIPWDYRESAPNDSDNKVSIAPIKLFYKIGYKPMTDLELPLALEGVKDFEIFSPSNLISFSERAVFLDNMKFEMKGALANAKLHYTLDGTEPNMDSKVYKDSIFLDHTTTVKAKLILADGMETEVVQKTFKKTALLKSLNIKGLSKGWVHYDFYEGAFNKVGDMNGLEAIRSGKVRNFNVTEIRDPVKNKFGVIYMGFINVPKSGMYCFRSTSNDGSILSIDTIQVVDNDGIHGKVTKKGFVALEKGLHSFTLKFIGKRFEEVLSWDFKLLNDDHEFQEVKSDIIYSY